MKKFRFLVILFYSSRLFSQVGNSFDFSKMTDFLPPSPNATALGKYGGVALNYNTGAPNITIPLFSVSGQHLKTELALHYNSSGIKVDEIASRVGMGWLITAGGVITRTVMGVADELSSQRYLPPNSINTQRKFYDAVQAIADYSNSTHGYDGQPDIFSYNFDGYSGRFVFDSLMRITLLPVNNLKFEQNFRGSDWNFRITTPQGVKYYFGGSSATETSKKGSTCGKNYDDYIPTAWYLTKIEHPYGEWITFSYTSLSFQYDLGRTESNSVVMTATGTPTGNYWLFTSGCFIRSTASGGDCGINCAVPTPQNCVNYINVNSKLLYQVNSASATVTFYYNTRSDCEDRLVSEIDYVDRIRRAFVNRYYFNYAYYGSNKIPYLVQLTKSSQDNTTEDFYRFNYYSPGGRPGRLSYAQDHWGFYNGRPNTTLLPPPLDSSIAWKFPNCTANRTVDFNFAVMGMLSRIIYPTGGSDSLVYESNDASPGSQNIQVGGVRIRKTVTTASPDQAVQIKRYYYADVKNLSISSGLYTGIAPYQKSFQTRYTCYDFCCDVFPQLECTPTFGYCDHLGIYSNSINNLFPFSSSPISYSSVIESNGENFENGAIQYKYLVGRDAPGQVLLNNDIMGAPYSSFSFLNGLPTETNVLKNLGGRLVTLKQTINTYKIDTSHSNSIPAYVVNRKFDQGLLVSVSPNLPTNSEWESFDVLEYDLVSRWFYPDSVKEISFDQNGTNPLTSIHTFFYDLQNLQLSRSESLNSKGELLRTNFGYPQAFKGTAVYDSMIQRYMIGPLVEQDGYINSNSNLILQTNYKFSGPLVVPADVRRSTDTGPLYTEGKFDLYDNRGNLLQTTSKNGVVTCYLWGYGQLYPVARIVGTTFQTLLGKIDTAALQKVLDDSLLRNTLNNLRSIKNAFVTTYTYKSSLGISSETDPNGHTTYYEYDSYNRLFLLRDFSKNIIKKFCYDFYGRPEECTIFYNTDTSMAFTRDCGTGYLGSTVRDSVRSGMFSSTTSQAAANQLAINYLLSNGPAYAVAHGSCALICSSSNCTGTDKKCINNNCEQGIKIYTSSMLLHGTTYNCVFHYRWSDGSISADIAEEHQGPCPLK